MARNTWQYTQQGYLNVGVFTPRQAKPVDNARVQIMDRERNTIVGELLSNSSGQTATIDLAAPPLEYSMNASLGQPYSEYDLLVTADGFDACRIENVQIFPHINAIQNVELLEQKAVAPTETEITIAPNTLWGNFPPKIPEDEVKPLPETEGYVVLPEPVIPEYIVVHAGVPSNTSAPDYWVPFQDYIKNVASCEIYATWPEATIEANVLAILSFTLNRVYTEWYRGKGYAFTITNSTAYDHAFTYGRNIYSEISRVVDRVFHNYVTRPNIRQPLFTQYCDGKRSQCPNWMTQWGSKDLGDQGYSAIDILKSFYGYDIYLMQATQVEGVPSSYPGTSLQMGSTGAAVRTIQNQLNAISNNYPAIKKMRVDGIFGQDTLDAVTTFQRVFDLPPSGIVDMATWYKISNIYVAVTRIAELN